MTETGSGRRNDVLNTVLLAEDILNGRMMLVAQAIMDVMPIMIAVFDQDLRYVYCNKQYVKMTNSPRPDWANVHISDYLPPSAYEFIKDKLQRALKGERISFHLDLSGAEASQRVVLVNYYPIASDGGKTVCLMTGQDVTELKEAELRLFSAQKLETLGQLTGGIAHDLNNHMGVIVGNLSLLKMQVDDEKSLRRVEACRDAAGRCTKLTSQLLSFASRQPLKPRSLTVAEHLNPIEDMLGVSVASNIEINRKDAAPDAAISVDTTQFGSAIMNLVLNARDAMPDGGTISIETSVVRSGEIVGAMSDQNPAPRRPDHELVRIEIRDTGQGMAPDVVKHAFEPFFTTKKEGAGSGMGLAMVYGFVRQSGGSIQIQSALGAGTSVRMFLPRVHSSAARAKACVDQTTAPEFTHTILVVEDNAEMAAATCDMLRAMGHVASTCDNASEALDIMSKEPQIDVVITDIMLRGHMTGLTLRQRIKERFPHVRTICVSGYQDQNAQRSYAAHPDIELIPKPFDYHELARRLSHRPSSG